MEADLEKLKIYLRRVVQAIQAKDPSELKIKSAVRFSIGIYDAIIDFTDSAQASLIEWDPLDREPTESVTKVTCRLESDLKTLVSMSSGKLSAMSAMMQGLMKITGNRLILKEIAFAFKEAVLTFEDTSKSRYSVKMIDTDTVTELQYQSIQTQH